MGRHRLDSWRNGAPERGVAPIGVQELSVGWCSTAQEIDEDLWVRCFPSPLEGRWWYIALERSRLEDQFTFQYLVIYEGLQPIGIAPTFSMDVPIDLLAPDMVARLLRAGGRLFPFLRYQRTLFVGSPCAEEGTVGLLPGCDLAQMVPVIQAELEGKARALRASMIVWKDFPNSASKALDRLTVNRRYFKTVSYPGTSVSLPEGDVGDYLAGLKKSRRQNLKRKLKLSRQQGHLLTTIVSRADDHLLAEIFPLFQATYQRGKTKFERLTPEFFQEIARAEPARFILLRSADSGCLVAFRLCFHMGETVINKFIGLDYSCPRDWSLLFRLWEAGLGWAMAAGVGRILSGQTGYSAKLETGHTLVPLYNYCRHRNPLLNRLIQAIARNVGWSDLDRDLGEYMKAHPELGRGQPDGTASGASAGESS